MYQEMYSKRKKSNKGKIIGFSLLLILGFVAYDYFVVSEGPGGPVAVSAQTNSAATREKLLNAFSRIQSLQIDITVFNNPAFSSLQDFTAKPTNDAVGKPNPFGAAASPAPTSARR